MKRLAFLAVCFVLFVSALYWGGNTITVLGQEEQPAFVPGQLIIGFRPGVTGDEIADFYTEYGLTEKEDLDSNPDDNDEGQKLAAVQVDVTQELIDQLESDPRVKYAEPNYMLYVSKTPTDPEWDKLWGLHNTGQTGGAAGADISAMEAWDVATGSKDVIVAVIDTGVDYTHEDLSANMWVNSEECPQGYGKCEANEEDDDGNGYIDDFYGANTINDTGEIMDDYGHGTHVAGTIGAVGNNGTGVVGVNWNVRILGCKFLSASGGGTTANAVKCFQYVSALRERGENVLVTNNSWGGGSASEALLEAMAGPDAPLHICAAGNANTDRIQYPAAYELDNIISVAATDHEDLYASFSNWGSDWVDLAAPGVDTYSTVPDGSCAMCDSSGYNLASGTSMATPHVTGAVALVLSKYKELTNEQVKQRLLSGIDALPEQPKKTLTNGRLNLLNAMEDDQTPPASVTDLTITGLIMTKVELSWTATGDDGVEGNANAYDVRYALTPITDANWTQALQVDGEPKPQGPGARETLTVGGLQPGVNYYFAMRVADNAGNLSELSNVASASTSEGTIVFQDDMESGQGSWTVSEEDALWHLSNLRSNSPSNAWYYGQDDTRNYETGESNAGFLTSPEITLAEADEALLVFSEWSQVQENLRFDRTRVQVTTDGNSWKTVFESHGTADKWEQRSISLGEEVDLSTGSLQVRFWFDTVNDRFNEFEGWYVDDVQVLAARMEMPGQQVEAPNLVLREGNIGFNPPNPTQGDNVTIHAVVLNTGAAESGPVVVQFADVTDGAPIPIGQPQTIAGIPVGGSGTVQVVYDGVALGHPSEEGPSQRDIQVMVDPYNFISEVSESDNTAVKVLPVLGLNAPNLKITAENIGFDPPAPDPGDQVTINATVLNTGPVDASDVVVQFMDVTRNGSQPIGQQQIIDAIPAGGSVLVQVTYDTTGLEGDRDIQVVIDPVNSVIESDESDNDAKAKLAMASQAAANLLVLKDNIGFAPATPTEGDTVTIYATILNDGGVDATDVLVQFIDTTDNGSTPIGQQQTIELVPAGGSGMVQVAYETGGKAGDRKIDVVVDPHNFIPEAKESDNTAKQTLTVATPPAPNLSIQATNIGFNPAAPVQSDNVTIRATILNNGELEASDVVVQFVDVTNGDSIPVGGRLTIASIAAGSSGSVETTYDTTNRPGDRRIQVVVDPGNFISESDETDNVARELLRVAAPPAPNLVALASNIEFHPARPTDQDTVVIHTVILNTGSQEARNVLVQFIDLTTGIAVPIGKEQFIDVIPMGGSATAEATYSAAGPVRGRKIQVLVDSNNLIKETSESDNEAIKTLAVSASAAPNLAVPPVTIGFAPRYPIRGDEITISAVIINNGAADAENVLVQFTDVTSGRAIPVGEQQVIEFIPMGGNGIATVTMRSSDAVGERKIRVIADPNNFISESDETDNRGDQTVMVAPPAAPNLVTQPNNITFAPPAPTDGQPVSVTVTILNDGGQDAEDVLVQFVDVTDGGMIPVGEKQTIELIPAGSSATAKVSYATAGKVGDRKIQVLVDPHTIIAEYNEKDNDATQSLIVAPAAAPNLVVEDSNISFSPTFPVEGDSVTLHVTILNSGSADATDVSVQFVDTTDDGDTPIGSSQNIDVIAAGGSATAEISYDTSGKQGDRKITVVVDRNNLIPETSEDDNEGTQTLTVVSSPAPNLIIQANNIGFNPPLPGEGDQVTINAAVLNTGSAEANDVTVQFVDVTTSNSAPIGQPQVIENIPAGGSGSAQITYDTTGMVGDRKIQVVVDPNNFIQEAKETDNQAQKTLEMVPLAAPNLVARDANVSFTPADVKTFEDVTITIAVLNDGTAEANDVVVRFFDVTSETPAPIGQPQTIENIPVGGSGTASVTYSAGAAVGERKIRVVVDPNNFISELKETDNEIKALTLKVTAHLGPNLVMLPGNVGLNPANPIDGDQVVLHAVVINNGASGVRDVDVQFVDVTGGGVVPIGAPQSITAIPAGASGVAEVTLDTEGRVGERKVRVVVDPNNFINEVNEEDNEATTSFTVSPPPAPNLSILPGNIKFEPAEPEIGNPVIVSVLVLNSGTADANDILVQFSDATDDAGLPIGTEQIIDSLPAGDSVTLEVTYTDTDAAGERRIQVAVDPSNSIEESDETDNRATKTLTVSPPKVPNLMIQPSAIEFAPAKPVEGDQVMITMTVQNNGTAPVTDVQVLVTDVTNNGSDPVGDPLVIESLGVGESATLNATYDTNGKAGSRQIQVTVDPDDAINESNEDDNEATKTIPVASEDETPPDAPNLVIFAGNIKFEPEEPAAGDPVTITVNVLNQGTQDAEELVVRFADVTDGGEELIGDVTLTGTVPAGDSAEVTITYDTTDLDGERSIQVTADPDNAIEESDEEDNSATKALPVGAPSEASAILNGDDASEDTVGEGVVANEDTVTDDASGDVALTSPPVSASPLTTTQPAAAVGSSASTRAEAPNLVVTAQDIVIEPAVVGDGGVINITALVRNEGAVAATGVTVLVNDVTGSDYTVAGRQQTIASIPAGGSTQVQAAYVVLDRPFERTVEVLLDPENVIAESDEFDNTAQLTGEPSEQGYEPAVEGR